MRPKYQLTWNETNTQLKINLKYDQTLQIEVFKQYGEKVQENEKIGFYIFENQKKSIISTINGYITWSSNQQSFDIVSGDQFQTVGVIYKNKEDIPFLYQEEIEFKSTSSSQAPVQGIQTFNFTQLAVSSFYGNFQVLKWRVNVGDYVSPAMILGICQSENDGEQIDLKSKIRGRVVNLAQTKTIYQKHEPILSLDGLQICTHLKIENNQCLFCYENIIRKTESLDLNYSDEMLRKISSEIVLDILKKKKLIMVLDLDQTILHAIKAHPNFDKYEFCEKENSQQIDENTCYNSFTKLGQHIKEHFLEMHCDQTSKFIIKLRPYFEQFFLTLIPLFDIYIYTKASKSYADFILNFISYKLGEVIPEHKPFFPPHRVFSREDTICQNSKSLNRLFYPGIATNLLVILDDNAGMWNQFKENLIHTKPFVYFDESSFIKDSQGINSEVQKEVKITNKHDFWLYTITQKLKDISDKFWSQVQQATDDPNFIVEIEQLALKSKKVKTEIIEEQLKLEERTLLDVIINRKISAPNIYADFRKNVLKGVTLFFAISEAHEEGIKKGLEQAKEKAYFLGAKIFREFKENEFVGSDNSFIITVGRRKIRSIITAQEKNIPIIHYKWIEDCDNYLCKIDHTQYIEKENGDNKHIDDESIRDEWLKNTLMKFD